MSNPDNTNDKDFVMSDGNVIDHTIDSDEDEIIVCFRLPEACPVGLRGSPAKAG